MSPLFDLSGKVAIVTGSTRGIGFAAARQLALSGAAVVVSGENAGETAGAAARLQAEGLAVTGTPCDVLSAPALEHLVHSTAEHFGRLDILVANAGITVEEGPMAAMSAAGYDRIMAINLHAVFQACTLAAPLIAAGGGGSVIIMSSLAALRGNRNLGVYGMTKAATAQLARNLAVEWGHAGVRANAVAPGLVDTGFADALKANPAALERRLARTPLGRMGTSDEIAGVAVFLASAAGAFITGQTIAADGGTLISD